MAAGLWLRVRIPPALKADYVIIAHAILAAPRIPNKSGFDDLTTVGGLLSSQLRCTAPKRLAIFANTPGVVELTGNVTQS